MLGQREHCYLTMRPGNGVSFVGDLVTVLRGEKDEDGDSEGCFVVGEVFGGGAPSSASS